MKSNISNRGALRRLFRPFAAAALLLLFLFPFRTQGFETPFGFEQNRARLLSYVLREDLESHHFTGKKIDDALSRAAFDIYLSRLDGQKRFLLRKDVEALRSYADRIDDELNMGRMELPLSAAGIMTERAGQARALVGELLSGNFDFSADESVETDPEKLDYCANEEEWRERWRKAVKLQVLGQYLSLLEEQAANPEDAKLASQSREELQKTARERVKKEYDNSFPRLIGEKEREGYDRYFGSVTAAFDPHTDYMPPSDKEDFDIAMRGSLEGIGATLEERDGYIKVIGIVPGGPASRQGQLQAEDIIMKVAEGKGEPVDLAHMRVKDAVKLIRGKKGTEVSLTVRKPDGSRVLISIIRDVVQLEDSFIKGTVLRDANSALSFGYIRIPSFYRDFEGARHGSGRNVTDDVRREIENLQKDKIAGLIIDLRYNGGGALTDAVQTAGLFIETGPVVQIKSSSGRINVLSDDDPAVNYSGPVVLLVNKLSASASEILAGALQDYGRAVVIGGEHTHGKGTVQTILDLDQNIPFDNMEKYTPLGAVRVTVQKFYRISGESTQYRGVLPDIVLPDRLSGVRSGEQYLDRALPWDTVPPASYSKWDNVRLDLPALRKKSLDRTRSDSDLSEIEAEAKRLAEAQKKTLQPLNIEVAKKERELNRQAKDRGAKDAHAGHGPLPGSTEKEKREALGKMMSADPYVREAIAVLGDLAPDFAGMSMR